MKYRVHVPVEQYGFIEAELEGEAHDAVTTYNEIKTPPRSTQGLPAREFCAFMDTYVSTGKPGDINQWEQMSDGQKLVINELKKCFVRLNKK